MMDSVPIASDGRLDPVGRGDRFAKSSLHPLVEHQQVNEEVFLQRYLPGAVDLGNSVVDLAALRSNFIPFDSISHAAMARDHRRSNSMSMSHHCLRIPTLGLAMALILSAGLHEVQAALGIVITQTTLMPVDDPLTQYDFKLSLVAGNELLQGDNITLVNIPNYSGFSSYVFVKNGFDFSQNFSITNLEGSSPGFSSIELQFIAPPPAAFINSDQNNNVSIGDLFVTTTVNYPPAATSPLAVPVAYTTQTHLYPSGILNLGAGLAPSPFLVPEPSSMALLGVGVVSALLIPQRRPPRPA